jgi:thiamine biosynthesis protein ThiI
MSFDVILLRFGEWTLKGKNKSVFANKLLRNVKEKCKEFSSVRISQEHGRMFIELNGQPYEPVIAKLQEVFGLVGFSPAIRVKNDLEEIKQAALTIVRGEKNIQTFKVVSKRSNKKFPIRSLDLNQKIGGHILANAQPIRVDVHEPDLAIHVEVRSTGTYVYGKDIPGIGGLPVGTSGRVLLLLSGGIDSPVAGYLSLKRGVELEAIHFHSYPYTSERAKQKVIDLAQILTRFGGKIRLHIVPFTEIQTEINRHCYESYSITIMRRMMLRIAEAIAHRRKALALVTGESLGQVASQTLESMNTINAVTNLPILRPLIGMDKQEIITISKKIGTYETSILPYEDCCTVFLPKAPKTKPEKEVASKLENRLDMDRLINEAVEQTEMIEIKPESPETFSYFS